MKEIPNFLKWWWKRLDSGEKAVFFLVLAVITCIAGPIFFGIKFLVYTGIALIAGLVLFLILALCIAVHDQWEKYHEHKAEEAQRIVDKLRGPDRARDLLEKLRKKPVNRGPV